MSFRINKGVFQFKDTVSDTFINKFKIDDRGDMVEVDSDGNKVTAYMRLGDKAHDADLLDGITSSSFLRSDADDTMSGYLRMTKNWGGGTYGAESLTVQGSYPSFALRNSLASANNKWLFHSNSSGNIGIYEGSTWDDNSWVNLFTFHRDGQFYVESGDIHANGTVYAKVFSDKDNTSYYLDPSNISYLNDIRPNIIYDRNDTSYKLDLNGDSRAKNLRTTGEFFAEQPAWGGFPLAPNLVHNSYLNKHDGTTPDGWSVLGNINIEVVSPWTQAFEGPYTADRPANAVDDPNLATESNPYYFGRYYNGPRIGRGGMRSGWHSQGDGRILKITGSGIFSPEHCAVYPPKEENNLGARWLFSCFVKIVKGSAFHVGTDAGYRSVSGSRLATKAQTDAGEQGWIRVSGMLGTSQITRLDGLAMSLAIIPDANGDIEGYVALPYLANATYKGTNYDSWSGSVIDKLARQGFYIHPTNGAIQSSSNTFTIGGNQVATQTWVDDTFLRTTEKAADSNLLDGIDSGAFLRSNTADTFTGSLTMGTQQSLKASNYGHGVYGRYDSRKYQHVWGMGTSWHMDAGGSNLGNFYGLAYTHTNIGGESKSGLSHQTLFVENGSVKTAIGRGIWTDGTITTTVHGTSANWNTAYGWGNHAGLYETAGASDAAKEELVPLISNAQTTADNAETAAINAQNTADTAETRANSAREAAAAAQATADGKLGATAKAADSNLLDGYDSSAFIRENQDRRHKVIRFTGEGGDSGNGDYNYAIYQAGGAWSHPYPDLIIAMHTGIKIGGYKNYGGVKIYNDAPERSGAQQVASFGDGDANVRVSNNLHIGSAGGWITDLLNAKETAGAADAVRTDLSGLISTATSTADTASSTASTANTTANSALAAANTAQDTADQATTFARAAQTTADSKLGATAKAADSNLLDGIDSGAFLRSNTDDNVTGNTEWQDNKQIRLGNSADFRMHFDGSHTIFRNYNHGNGNIYFQGEDTAGANHALLYMFTANTRPYVSLYEDGGERFKTTSAGVEVLGDAYINQGRIHIKRGTGLTHTEWEDDSSANGRAQLILDSHYSDLIIASRNANNNKHGSTLTLATQSTSTNDVAKWVIGQGQYQEGANIMAFSYGVNQTNPHSILGTDNANAEMLITNGSGVWSRNGFASNEFRVSGTTNGGKIYADEWGVKVGTDSGYIQFGPANDSWAHIYTDRDAFYTNKPIYENNARLATQSYAVDQKNAAIAAANDRFNNEVMPQVTTNATNIARNATDIANKAAAGGSYSQDFAADDMRVDQWFRNTVSGKGLYNEATGQHWYSDDDDYWNVAGGSAANGIRFRDEHGGTIRGYFYANNSNQVGILDAGGSWAIRHTNDSATEFYDADERVFSIGQGGHGSNYGTVCTHGGGRGGWEGYSINERFVWMSSDNTLCGMYNDMDNEWMTQYHRNGAVKLYHNGGLRLETQSGGAKVHGTMTATAFSGSLDWANVTNKPTIPAATPPVQATVEGGPDSTLVSIAFSPGEGAATFTLADGQSFRLAFAR